MEKKIEKSCPVCGYWIEIQRPEEALSDDVICPHCHEVIKKEPVTKLRHLRLYLKTCELLKRRG